MFFFVFQHLWYRITVTNFQVLQYGLIRMWGKSIIFLLPIKTTPVHERMPAQGSWALAETIGLESVFRPYAGGLQRLITLGRHNLVHAFHSITKKYTKLLKTSILPSYRIIPTAHKNRTCSLESATKFRRPKGQWITRTEKHEKKVAREQPQFHR